MDSHCITVPAWGTFAQGQLVDAVQRSLYSKDVSADEIIRLTIWSIISSNSRTLVGVILCVFSSPYPES